MFPNKQKTLILVGTGLFILAFAVLQYLHMQADTEAEQVSKEYSIEVNTELTTEFFDDWGERDENRVGSDLGY